VSGSSDSTVKLWDVNTGAVLQTFTGHISAVNSVAFRPNGLYILSGSADETIKLWLLGFDTFSRSLVHNGSIVTFSPDGQKFLSIHNENNRIQLWNMRMERLIGYPSAWNSNHMESLAYSPDGRTFLTGESNKAMGLRDISSGLVIRSFGHSAPVYSVAYSFDGQKALSGGGRIIRLWNISTGHLIYTFSGHNDIVKSVAYSPDGKTALSGSQDKTMKLWDINTGELIRTFQGHSGSVNSVVYSPDGQTALSASSDGTIKLWNLNLNSSLPNGDWSFCSSDNLCSEGQGDCDGDSQCQSSLVCTNNVGANYGFNSSVDVCEVPPVSNGDWSFCSTSKPCSAGQGDCDSDSQCKSGLVCIRNVGANYGFVSGIDVCELPSCTYNLSRTNRSHSASSSSSSISVDTDSICNWTATSNNSWITITSGNSYSGDSTVNYTIAENTSTQSRTGTLTIAGQTFTINQAGASISCSYSTSPINRSHNSGANSNTISIYSSSPNCDWIATSDSSWINITEGENGSGNGTVYYSIPENLSAQDRIGNITIANQTFRITQSGASCSYSISPTNHAHTAIAGDGNIQVYTSPSNCDWTVMDNRSWITITSSNTGSGRGSVSYTVSDNPNTQSRSGIITIENQSFRVNQEGVVLTPIVRIDPTILDFTGSTGQLSTQSINSYATTSTVPQDRTILLKHQTVNPNQMIGNTTNSVETVSGQEKRHLLVQFEGMLMPEDKSALQEQGIHLLNYIPNFTYWISIDKESNITSISDIQTVTAGGITWLWAPSAEYKISQAVINNSFPNNAKYDDGTYKVHIIIFDDVSQAEASQAIINYLGQEIQSLEWIMDKTLAIRLPYEAIYDLASLDEVRWVEPAPPPNATQNAVAAQRINVDDVRWVAPYNLSGNGVSVGIWDGGAVYPHNDLSNRLITKIDTPSYNQDTDHATHVAGTIAGSGIGDYRAQGMAPKAYILSYDFHSDISEILNAVQGSYIDISNHSYSSIVGITCTPNGSCSFYNNTGLFGEYSDQTYWFDKIVFDTDLLIFKAAGNDRGDCALFNGIYYCDGTYDTIPERGNAKNIITIGATTDDNDITTFSSFGPSDDGRIKPDLCANGELLYSTLDPNQLYNNTYSSYGSMSGTSMASPSAAGAGALLFEHYRNTEGDDPKPGTLKTLMIHGAQDLGGAGPDYMCGWGLIDTHTSAKLISQGAWQINRMTRPNENQIFSITVTDTTKPLKATLGWTDPPGNTESTNALINDLNLVLISPSNIYYYPWILGGLSNPTANARRGVNNVDNIEQVVVENPEAGVWKAWVNAKTLDVSYGSQSFTIVAENILPYSQMSGQFTIYNNGNATLSVNSITPQTNAPWLTVNPTSFTVSPNASKPVTVTVDSSLIPSGQHTTQLLISDNSNENSSVYVKVNSPMALDTDIDGYTDEEEITAGSDPFDINSTPNNINPSLAYPTNISTRSPVRGGANNTIAGFIISGTGTKKVVIRAEGKGLTSRLPAGSQVLADAKLVLYKLVNGAWQVIAENDNWQSDSRASEIPTHMQLTDISDAGLLRDLEAGVYTAIVQPATTSTATGVTLVSVNDLDDANTKTSELVNISTRAPIEGGTGNVIAGFIVSGAGTQNVVITARGKSVNMSQDVLCQDPFMAVHKFINGSWTQIATNDNWQTDAQSTNIPAHLQPTDASDAALFLSLEASPYTAIMSCKSGTGVGLIGVNTVD